MEDTREKRLSNPSRSDAHMNSQRLWQHAWDLHRSVSDGVPALRVEGATRLHS